MEEESADNVKTTGPPSSSGTPSPRSNHGTGSAINNDNNGGIVNSGNSVNCATMAINEAPLTTRATTTSVGVVAGSTNVVTINSQSTLIVAPSSTTETGISSMTSSLTTGTTGSAIAATTAPSTTTTPPTGIVGSVVSSSLIGSGSFVTGAKSSGNSSPRSPKLSRKNRVKLGEQQLESATREELAAKWREQDLYVECLEAQAAAQEGELACLRDSEEKYRQQCCEITHRERILVRRLASKEQQILGYVNQITELRASQTTSASALRSALLDPAVNILIQKLRQELLSTKAKLEDTQNELSAWKFTPDSNTGKRLMAKCRLLYQENEELGRMIASGRIAKLEGELVLQKSFSEEVKKSQSELDEFLQDLDEDVEGMQSTIYFLQQELRKARESVSLLQQENNAFKSVSAVSSSSSTSSSTSSISPLSVPPQPPPQPPPPQPPPPPPPPPPSSDNNGLPNGVVSSGHQNPAMKVEQLDPGIRSSEDPKKVIEGVKLEANVEEEENKSSAKSSSSRTPPPLASIPSITTTSSLNLTKSDSPELVIERHRPEEPDESSNDSAALIIKVENEELSDRDDEDEDDKEEEVACPKRGPQRQSLRNRDKTTTTTTTSTMITSTTTSSTASKGDCGVLVGNKSNGDERSSSRPSSRRLVRDRTAKRDKSAADSDDDRRLRKKKRRESILSLDYNETDDDALLITNGENIQSDPDDGP